MRTKPSKSRTGAAAAALIAALLAAGGCSRQEPAPAPSAAPRGELIVPAGSNAAPVATAPPTNSGTAAKPEKFRVAKHPGASDYWVVGFDILASYTYPMPDDLSQTNAAAATGEAIPQEIRELNQERVALKGYMLPLKVEGGLVTEMLIMRDQSMCCYGTVPKINEWVSVKMTSAGVKPIMDQPVTLLGKLRVGEMRENGYLVGIYGMDGDKLIRD